MATPDDVHQSQFHSSVFVFGQEDAAHRPYQTTLLPSLIFRSSLVYELLSPR